jgi:D-3-phosphoglycerate dehydrogenase
MGKDVLILSRKFRDHIDFAREFLTARGCSVAEREIRYPIDEDQLIELIRDVDGLITGLEQITPRVLDHANRLRVISAGGVGYDHINVDEASRRGIAVCICAGCNNHSVSELAFGMMIGLSRSVYVADRGMRQGQWERFSGQELWGKTLGIVGLGRVGRSTALLGKAFGMRLLATDIAWDLTFANEHGISYVPVERLLRESDYVSLHVPLTPQTRHLINERTLDLMKPSAFLINTARGPVVKQSALVDALQSRRIAGAALDVFEVEPHPNNPYVGMENVILTPHIGGSTSDAFDRAYYLALLNVSSVLNDQPPHCQVNELALDAAVARQGSLG